MAIPAITHAVAPAVSFSVTHSPKDDYYCYLCDAHRVYCALCDASRHSSAYTTYAVCSSFPPLLVGGIAAGGIV